MRRPADHCRDGPGLMPPRSRRATDDLRNTGDLGGRLRVERVCESKASVIVISNLQAGILVMSIMKVDESAETAGRSRGFDITPCARTRNTVFDMLVPYTYC